MDALATIAVMDRFSFVTLVMLTACSSAHVGSDDAAIADDAGVFTGAYLTPDCAPNDGAALTLTLYEAPVPECSADPDRRSLTFYFYPESAELFPIEAGDTIDSTNAGGSVSQCPGGTPPCRAADSWSITFTTYEEEGAASGTYTATFDGETISGSFDATWCNPGLVCG